MPSTNTQVLRLTTEVDTGARTGRNTFFFRPPATSSPRVTPAITVADTTQPAVLSALAVVVQFNCTITALFLRDMTDPAGVDWPLPFQYSTLGARHGIILPAEVGFVFTRHVGVPGMTRPGHIVVSPCDDTFVRNLRNGGSEAAIPGLFWDGPSFLLMQPWTLIGEDWIPCLWSPTRRTSADLVSWSRSRYLGTRRSRRLRGYIPPP